MSQLGRAARSAKSGERVLGMFRAFIDESGLQCDVFAVSGFVGAESEWALFSQEWEPIIKTANVTYHAAQCEGGYGEFAGWSREQKDALNIALIDCLAKRQIFGVGMSAVVEDFRDVWPTSPETLWRDLYVELLEIVIIQAVNRMVERLPGQHMTVICDQQNQFEGAATRMFEALRTDTEWNHRHKLEPPIRFESRRQFLPLQAADKVAYETFRSYMNQFYNPKLKARMAMYRIFDFPFYTAYCTKDSFLRLKNMKAKTSDLLPWVEEIFKE